MANYPKYQGQRMVKEDEYSYLQELIEAHEDPSAEWGGASYTAGTGIDITSDEISIDDTVVATKTDLEDYELKADAFSGDYDDLTNKPDLSAYQTTSNLVTSLSNLSTDTQYPSAKCVYDIVGNIESLLAAI